MEEEDESSFGENEKLLENKLNKAQGKGAAFGQSVKAFLAKPQGKAMLGVGVIFVFFVIIKLFFSEPNRFEQIGPEPDSKAAKAKDDTMLDVPSVIKKQAAKPEVVSAPPVAPQLKDPEIPEAVNFKNELMDDEPKKQKEPELVFEMPEEPQDEPSLDEDSMGLLGGKKRVRSENAAPMFNLAGSGPRDTDDGRAKKSVNDFIFIGGDIETSSDDNFIEPKRIPALENTIAQGRTLNAVLETSIDSSIQGQVRAIVSNDIYAEISDNILIPRGSRLYGSYQSNVSRGIARLGINFTRIIRPDGVSVDLSSYAADQFGRAGVEGDLDNNYGDMFGATFLTSLITIGNALALSQINNNLPNGSIASNVGQNQLMQTIQTPASTASQELTRLLTSSTTDIVKSMFQTAPRITINQGTRITIIVNQDIKLPIFKQVKSSYSAVRYYDSASSKSNGKSSGSGGSSSSSGGSSSLSSTVSSVASSAMSASQGASSNSTAPSGNR